MPIASHPDTHVVLILGGGNALGAYQAGVYESLHARDIEPDWVVGTSVGSVNGALIAGNLPGRRLNRLRDLWRPGTAGWWPEPDETARRSGAALATLVGGRPGMFAPIGPLGSWWLPDPAAGATALFDTTPMVATLRNLVDFDRLNDGPIRYAALAVDVENGEEIVFDTHAMRLGPDHIRASTALMPSFPPIEVDGRLLADGGLSANLALDPVLSAPTARPTLCIAADLLPLQGARPRTLGESIQRMQDLTFAAQSRRSLERWTERYASDPPLGADGKPSAVTLVRLAYTDQEDEVAGKAMDFSPQTIAARWRCGHRDATAMLDALDRGEITLGTPGLTVHHG